MADESRSVVTPADLDALEARLTEVEAYRHIDEARGRVGELEQASAAPGLRDDADAARAHMAELAQVKGDVALVDGARSACPTPAPPSSSPRRWGRRTALSSSPRPPRPLPNSTRSIDEMELSSWFTGEFDHGSAILSIKPGQGGLEAQDWTFMLFKMYMKYCARRGWKVTVNDCPAAEVIGIDRPRSRSRARTHSACSALRPVRTAWCASAPRMPRSAARPPSPA